MLDSRRICNKCGYQNKQVFLNQECNHAFCQNCLQSNTRLHQQTQINCLIEGCKTKIAVKSILNYFGQEQKETHQQKQQVNIIQSSTMKSKQYQSPNELNYEQRQQLLKEMKVEVSETLNYCAVCLFYIEDLKQCNQRETVLGCRIHTLCTLCIIKYYEHQRNKQFFCEICERLNK